MVKYFNSRMVDIENYSILYYIRNNNYSNHINIIVKKNISKMENIGIFSIFKYKKRKNTKLGVKIMRHIVVITIFTFVLVLTGCSILELGNDENTNKENHDTNPGENYEDAFYVPVQEYKGENFALHPDGNKSLAVINKEREKVEEEVRSYFQENYHTDVTVHNIVGTENRVSAFVEAKG